MTEELFNCRLRLYKYEKSHFRRKFLLMVFFLELLLLDVFCIGLDLYMKKYWITLLCAVGIPSFAGHLRKNFTEVKELKQNCRITRYLIDELSNTDQNEMSLEDFQFFCCYYGNHYYEKYLNWLERTNMKIFPAFHVSYDTNRVRFLLDEATCAQPSSPEEKPLDAPVKETDQAAETKQKTDLSYIIENLLKELQDCEFGTSSDKELQREAAQTKDVLKTVFCAGSKESLDDTQKARFCDRYLIPLTKELSRWKEVVLMMTKLHLSVSDVKNGEIAASVLELRGELVQTLQAVRNAAVEAQMEVIATQADTSSANLKTIQSILVMDGYNRPMKANEGGHIHEINTV